jgi:hypothetical protein
MDTVGPQIGMLPFLKGSVNGIDIMRWRHRMRHGSQITT